MWYLSSKKSIDISIGVTATVFTWYGIDNTSYNIAHQATIDNKTTLAWMTFTNMYDEMTDL